MNATNTGSVRAIKVGQTNVNKSSRKKRSLLKLLNVHKNC